MPRLRPRFLAQTLLWSLALGSGVAVAAPGKTVLSPSLDAEITALHADMEELWNSVANTTAQLQALGVAGSPPVGSGGLPAAGLGGLGAQQQQQQAQPGAAAITAGSAAPAPVSPDVLQAVQKRQAEFVAMQETAFRIGRESKDNVHLSNHPDFNNYLQSLREFKPKLTQLLSDLEKEHARVTGQPLTAAKKKKGRRPTTIRGLSEADIRARARKSLKDDTRPFRAQAMDLLSVFMEGQRKMQDKQGDLQRVMEGPDWPKEDWPLTTSEAKQVGEAETLIQAALEQLNAQLEAVGGIQRAHESDDPAVLEQLLVLNEMMSGYGDIIDKHVAAVRRVTRGKKKASRAKSAGKAAAAPPQANGQAHAQDGAVAGSLREQLLAFGAQNQGGQQQAQPFAWLRDAAPAATSTGAGSPNYAGAAMPGSSAGLRSPSLESNIGSTNSNFKQGMQQGSSSVLGTMYGSFRPPAAAATGASPGNMYGSFRPPAAAATGASPGSSNGGPFAAHTFAAGAWSSAVPVDGSGGPGSNTGFGGLGAAAGEL